MRDKKIHSQQGLALVENLVALTILSISLAGSVSLFVTSTNINKASRTYSALSAEVQDIVDQYRNESFAAILERFAADPTSIDDGDQITESYTSEKAKANLTATLTAIKTRTEGTPEAIRLHIAADQRRAKLGNINYSFETLIANVQ